MTLVRMIQPTNMLGADSPTYSRRVAQNMILGPIVRAYIDEVYDRTGEELEFADELRATRERLLGRP